MKKLEFLLDEESNLLSTCAYCHHFFTLNQIDLLKCPKAKIFIDFHGNIISKHLKDRYWSLNKFINYLHGTWKMSWRDIYWKIWSYTIGFECEKCGKYFTAAEGKMCAYHPLQPTYLIDPNYGVYAIYIYIYIYL